MTIQSTNVTALNISEFVRHLRTQKIAQQEWPPGSMRLTLPELLSLHAPDLGGELDRAMGLAEAVLDNPIVAVAGLNDQGKSSLVASFLSPAGAGRVLRGTKSAQATYRFTLWLPASWGADMQLRAVLDKALACVFGHALEPLPEDAAAAFKAQNANDALHIPLVAWDERLDELGLALLDCPDIQKRPPGAAEGSPDCRYEVLKKAGTLCAASIIIAKAENATIREFEKVRDAMPGESHVYAFNQVRPNEPDNTQHELLAELRQNLQLPPDTLYFAAYDYGVIGYEERTPMWDTNRQLPKTAVRFPCFFRLTDNAEESAPESISEDRSLHHLAKVLNPDSLIRDFHRETRHRLASAAGAALQAVEQKAAALTGRVKTAQTDVEDCCRQALKGKDGQRIILSADMAQDFADSILRCAPWYIKGPLKVKAAAAWVAGKVSGVVSWMTPGMVARYGRTIGMAVRAKFFARNGGKEAAPEEPTKDTFSRMLYARWSDVEEAVIQNSAVQIFKKFEAVGMSNLSQKKWDEIARSFWSTAPKGTAAITTATSMVGALGVVIYTAFEPLGGAALTTFVLGGKGLVALTVKELLAAVGVGALVGGVWAVGLQVVLEKELGPFQIRRFYTLACDELGLPRDKSVEGDPPVDVNLDGICLRTRKLRRETLDVTAVKEMKQHLENL